MSDTSREIVDQIESGKLQDAKDSIQQGIKQKAAEIVDMKRVEMSVDWANDENLETDNNDSE
tara:strand:- start:211 stop:396 length:186 start_codon:yes stop_codon:yes gene_type:complete